VCDDFSIVLGPIRTEMRIIISGCGAGLELERDDLEGLRDVKACFARFRKFDTIHPPPIPVSRTYDIAALSHLIAYCVALKYSAILAASLIEPPAVCRSKLKPEGSRISVVIPRKVGTACRTRSCVDKVFDHVVCKDRRPTLFHVKTSA
jgi:hypothetical protein